MDQHPWVSLKEILKIRLILSISNLDIMAFIQFHSWGIEIIFRSLVFLHFLFYDQHHVLNVHCFMLKCSAFLKELLVNWFHLNKEHKILISLSFKHGKGNMNHQRVKMQKNDCGAEP